MSSLVLVHAVSTVLPASMHINGEWVLLVTAHVCITHVVEHILVCAWGRGGSEVELYLVLGLESETFDRLQTVVETQAQLTK